MPGEANETYVPFMSVLTAFKSTRVSPGTTARTYFVIFLPILTIRTMHLAAWESALPRIGLTISVRPSGA
jgi:hypothetical protein